MYSLSAFSRTCTVKDGAPYSLISSIAIDTQSPVNIHPKVPPVQTVVPTTIKFP